MWQTIISVEQFVAEVKRDWLVIDCRYSLADSSWGECSYLDGHLPHAYYFDLEDDFSSAMTEKSGRHPLPNATRLLKELYAIGMTPETQIIVYDDASGFMAARCWWLLRSLGHKSVALLDGGMAAWVSAGHSLVSGAFPLKSVGNEPVDKISFTGYLTTQEIEQSLKDKTITLVDARSAERFQGIEEPIDPVAGHIPGASNFPITNNLSDGHLASPEILRERWLAHLAGAPAESVVHMCGSGVTACFNLLAMEVAGLTGSRIYAGSWSEWIKDKSRPVAVGE